MSFDLQVQSSRSSSLSLFLTIYLLKESLHGVLMCGQSGNQDCSDALLGTTQREKDWSNQCSGVLTFVYETLYSFSSMLPANLLITLHFWPLFTLRFFLNPLFLHSYVCDFFSSVEKRERKGEKSHGPYFVVAMEARSAFHTWIYQQSSDRSTCDRLRPWG